MFKALKLADQRETRTRNLGLGDRRLIHLATRAAYIRGGETMICQKALPLQVRLVVSCQHLSRLYNLTFF